jgi:hypothetical protein
MMMVAEAAELATKERMFYRDAKVGFSMDFLNNEIENAFPGPDWFSIRDTRCCYE